MHRSRVSLGMVVFHTIMVFVTGGIWLIGMLVYYLLNKRWSSLKIIALIIVIGIVCGLTGILTYAA